MDILPGEEATLGFLGEPLVQTRARVGPWLTLPLARSKLPTLPAGATRVVPALCLTEEKLLFSPLPWASQVGFP